MIHWTDRYGEEWTPVKALLFAGWFVVTVVAMLVLDGLDWLAERMKR